MLEFFIKLVDGSKLRTCEEEFNDWLYNLGDDFIVCYGENCPYIYVKKEKILLGYTLKGGDK